MQWITVGGRPYLKYWHSDDPIIPKRETKPMTPEERAKSVLHFLDEYLESRERKRSHYFNEEFYSKKNMTDRDFLGMALVALVTDAQRKVDE